MANFGMVVEDPFYDEDGQLVDEYYDEEQGARVFDNLVKTIEELSPFETVNS